MKPLRLISLVVAVACIAMPAAATSAVTIEAFGEFCLDRALLGRPVLPAAEERGMEITSRTSETYAPGESFIRKMFGIPLTVVTTTGFGAHKIRSGKLDEMRSSMPEGIVFLQLGVYKTSARDPAGRKVELVTCAVISGERPSAARALIEVQRELSDKLPREAVASEPDSRNSGGTTFEHIDWTWGDIDSDAGLSRVSYSGSRGTGYQGGGMLFVHRLVRVPE